MFSMCSELTPRAHVLDNRIPQLMQPWCQPSSQLGLAGTSFPSSNINSLDKGESCRAGRRQQTALSPIKMVAIATKCPVDIFKALGWVSFF